MSDSNTFNAPSSFSYAPIGKSVNYDVTFKWVSTTGEPPANFKTLASVALTGRVTARAATGPAYDSYASASGYGAANLNNEYSPASAVLHIPATATTLNTDTGVLEDKTPPARVFEGISEYGYRGAPTVSLGYSIGVSGSVGASATKPGCFAAATGSLTNTTTVTLPYYAGPVR